MHISSHHKILTGFILVMAAAAVLAATSLAWLYHLERQLAGAPDGNPLVPAMMAAIHQGYWLVIGVGALGTLLSVGCIAWVWSTVGRVLRTVARTLQETSSHVLASSAELSAGSSQVAQNANRAATTIGETGQALERLADHARRYTANAEQAKQLAEEARRATDSGAADMQELAQAIEGIAAGGREVARVIGTIDQIAFQTNILALNAAVEASRAGDAGLGFGVVASEVHALAHRCAEAAHETAARIDASGASTRQGLAAAGRATAGLKRVAECNRQLDALAAEVAAGSEQQAREVAGLHQACGSLSDLTQANAETAGETAQATDALREEVGRLRTAVLTLRDLVEGTDRAAPSSAKPATSRCSPRDPPQVSANDFAASSA